MTEEQIKKTVWLRERKGILTQLAEAFQVSRPFVSQILHGKMKSKDLRIERRLAELRAPGFALNGPVFRARNGRAK
jgi:hypothetical protein